MSGCLRSQPSLPCARLLNQSHVQLPHQRLQNRCFHTAGGCVRQSTPLAKVQLSSSLLLDTSKSAPSVSKRRIFDPAFITRLALASSKSISVSRLPLRAVPVVASHARPKSVHSHIFPVRKLFIGHCPAFAGNENASQWMEKNLIPLAKRYESVEVILKERAYGDTFAKAVYLNNKEKVVSLKGLTHAQIEAKIRLLLDASGKQSSRDLKNHPVESKNENPRGIWSPFHVALPSSVHSPDDKQWRI